MSKGLERALGVIDGRLARIEGIIDAIKMIAAVIASVILLTMLITGFVGWVDYFSETADEVGLMSCRSLGDERSSVVCHNGYDGESEFFYSHEQFNVEISTLNDMLDDCRETQRGHLSHGNGQPFPGWNNCVIDSKSNVITCDSPNGESTTTELGVDADGEDTP